MQSREIRKKFFDFFAQHHHTIVPSSSLIPAQDPTLLFTNAGMNQFKDVFLGTETRSYKRAVSIQKCMRAGGKHNDLDNVGFTSRHLTFFEMMGNFSFGDYFKKEAIRYAWDFLVNHMNFDPTSIYATVYQKDDEAYALWQQEIGLPPERIFKLGAADNFWQMGDTGPCGPCSEILIDRGPQFGCGKPDCSPQCPCGERFLEVWNLVFMEFDRQPDGTDKRLKRVGVDTGMGLERLCAIMQNTKTVFQTDLFMPIINKTSQLIGIPYQGQSPEMQAIFHVLADHTRAATFLIADGCSPSNEGRGYVLRKIIRRAALFAQKVTATNILPALAEVVIEQMMSIYPDLPQHRTAITKLLTTEVQQFSANLVQGRALLEQYFKNNAMAKKVSGAMAFKLYDTHGFPLELTRVMAREHGFSLDEQGFEAEMEHQRQQSGKKTTPKHSITLPETIKTAFTGYHELETASTIQVLLLHDQQVDQTKQGELCWVIPKETPFFVACGGQVADQGAITIDDITAPIKDLKKIDGAIAIALEAPVNLHVGQEIQQKVDHELRWRTAKNHTATHLLQSALIELFGKQVRQAGSLVHPDYLRFDFTYCDPLTPQEITLIEERVNRKIMENIPVKISEATFKQATERGVMAIFGEKYNPESVRVVEVPGFSAELCGGTHVKATGDIGVFKITESSALSAGQRRIVALTGPAAVHLFQQRFTTVEDLVRLFKIQPDQVLTTIGKQQELIHDLQLTVRQLKKKSWQQHLDTWRLQIVPAGKIPLIFVPLEEQTPLELKEIAHALASGGPEALYFLVSGDQEKTVYYGLASPSVLKTLDLPAFAVWLKTTFSLAGGAKAPSLQGGGPAVDAAQLKKAVHEWLTKIS
jgi:alanyl-tRNA synthetase